MGVEVPDGWHRQPLKDLVEELYSGRSPSCEERRIEDGEWGLLKTTAITWENGWDERAHKVAPKSLWSETSMAVTAGDILLTKAGPRHRVGVVAYVDQVTLPVLVSGKMVGLRPDRTRVVPRYLADILSAREAQDFLHARTTGMAESQVNFTHKNLFQTPVLLPPLPEQRKIAAILSGVDDAIAATRKVIEQMKRVKKGLLQTLMTRGIGHTRFKKTEIGVVPEEWEVVRLESLFQEGIRNGYSPNCPNTPTGRWVLSLGALSPEGLRVEEKKPAPKEDQDIERFLLKPGDFLISRSNTRDRVGWSAMYRGEVDACAFPDLMMQFRVRPEMILPEYLEAYLYSRPALHHLQGRAAGTSGSMVKINQKVVKSTPVALPPLKEQAELMGIVASIRQALIQNQTCGNILLSLKRGLMQDLLTGRVRVQLD